VILYLRKKIICFPLFIVSAKGDCPLYCPLYCSVSAIKRIIGASKKQMAYNRFMPLKEREGYYYDTDNNWNLRGMPASFIVPEVILLEELEIEKEERALTVNLPVVPNPLTE